MNTTTAKLIALRKRLQSALDQHWNLRIDQFEFFRRSFLAEIEKLKADHKDLTDFRLEDYNRFFLPEGEGYYPKDASMAMIADMDYFIGYLQDVEAVQTPAVRLTEEGMYFAGQHFDALLKFNDIIAKATSEIVLVDGYINEKVLDLLASKNRAVMCRVLTLPRSSTPALNMFVEAFNKQNGNLEVKTTDAFHDRFVVIDRSQFYHFGTSIKDAGNKGFMYSRIEEPSLQQELLRRIDTVLTA